MHVRKNDQVMVITGKDKNTKGKITVAFPKTGKVIVEGVNMVTRHQKARNALRETGAREYCIGGGVAANPHLRAMMVKKLGRQGIRVTVPPQNACTDNAAMIAEVARRKLAEGDFARFDIDADPNMTL